VRPDVLPAYRRSGRAEAAATPRGGALLARPAVTPFTSSLPSGNMQAVRGRGASCSVAGATRFQGGSNGAARVRLRAQGITGGLLVESLQPRRSHRSSWEDPSRLGATPKTTDAAPPLPWTTLRRGWLDWAQLGVLHHQDSPLCLAQTSPDAVRLTDAQCVTEARFPHGAGSAYGFRLLLPLELLALSLEVRRWEEDDGLRPTTCSTNLPVFLNTLCAHRHTPLPSRTIQPVLFRNKENLPRARGASGGRLPGQRGCRCLLTAACTRMRTAPGRGNASTVNSACGRESHSPDGPRSR
jgi:hypothetical protein